MKNDSLKLLLGNKGSECFERFYHMHIRLPRLFPLQITRKTLHFLPFFDDDFLEQRAYSLIFRILSAFFRIQNKVKVDCSSHSKVFIQIINAGNSTLGLGIAAANLGKYELFSQEHISLGLEHLLSGIRIIESSYCHFYQNSTAYFYLEIKKIRGGFFSKSEIEKLRHHLSRALNDKIEHALKPIVIPDVEENIYKHIKQLSKELTHPRDIPQVMIFFSEYSQHKLIFFVVILRILLKDSKSLSTLCQKSTVSVKISLEKMLTVDFLDKKFPKEAAIYKIQLNSSFCVQVNTVNLRIARQYIKKLIENAYGEIRDFNGGLLIKEDEQLQKIKSACKQMGCPLDHLEDLFFGIEPKYIRIFLLPQTAMKLLNLIQEAIVSPIPNNLKHLSVEYSSNQMELIVVKMDHLKWISQLHEALLNSDGEIGSSLFEKGGFGYLCFFKQNNTDKHSLNEKVDQYLKTIYESRERSSASLLRVNLQGGDPSSLNPRLASDIHCHTLCSLLFEGLTRINGKGETEPALAKRIKISPNGLEYIFYLRNSAWSNSKEVTAYDFEKSWKKALMDSVPSFLCPKLFFYIKNASKIRNGELPLDSLGIKAIDRKTLWVKLEKPCRYFLHLVSTPLFFPLHGDAEEPKYFNGPFYLDEWKHDQSLSLSRNPFYWDYNNLGVNGIKFYMEKDAEQAFKMFLNNQLDVIGDPISPLNLKILKDTEKQLIKKSVSRIFWIHCNTRLFPLQEKLIRQALNLAINRKKIAEEIFYKQQPHCSPLPSPYAHYSLNLEGDPEKAKSLFRQGLKRLNLKKKDFPVLELIHSNLAFEKNLAEELKQTWSHILGIQINTKELPWSDFSSALEKGDFQLGGLFRRNLFNHPQFYLSFFRQSSLNPYSLDNPEYEKLFEQTENSENLQAIHAIEQLLIEEAPVFPLISQVYYGLVQQHIAGIRWSPNGCIYLNEIIINEKSTDPNRFNS